jgi:hypothetical protein
MIGEVFDAAVAGLRFGRLRRMCSPRLTAAVLSARSSCDRKEFFNDR